MVYFVNKRSNLCDNIFDNSLMVMAVIDFYFYTYFNGYVWRLRAECSDTMNLDFFNANVCLLILMFLIKCEKNLAVFSFLNVVRKLL